jgi:hypothetical protein
MAFAAILLCVLPAAAAPADVPTEEKQRAALSRLAEEAEVFTQLAPKIFGQEKLEQRCLKPTRFRARLAGAQPTPQIQTREILSEYGFATLEDSPADVREMRQVIAVDGRQVRAPELARETLTMGLRTEGDKLKKRMLREFQSYGLQEAATDFGQMVLLFTKRKIGGFQFGFQRYDQMGADRVMVMGYRQTSGQDSLTVFQGREAIRASLQGEVWFRDSDGLPLRITLNSDRVDNKLQRRHVALVDYMQSAYGVLLPVSIHYQEQIGGQLLTESIFQYSNFKMFAANSEVKFTTEEPPK